MDDYRILYMTKSRYRGRFGESAFAIVNTVDLVPRMGIAILDILCNSISLIVWSPVVSHDLVRFYRAVRILDMMKDEVNSDQRLLFAAYNISQKQMNSRARKGLEFLRDFSINIDDYREKVLQERIPNKTLDKMLNIVNHTYGGRVSYLEKYLDEGIITKTRAVQKALDRNKCLSAPVDDDTRKARRRLPIDGRLKKFLRKYGIKISNMSYAISGTYLYVEDYDLLVCNYDSAYHYYNILCKDGPKSGYIGHPIVYDKNLGTIILIGYSFQFPSKKGDTFVSYADYADETKWIDVKEMKYFWPDCFTGIDHKYEHKV